MCKSHKTSKNSIKPMTSQGNGNLRTFNSVKALWGSPTSHCCHARIKRQLRDNCIQFVFMYPSVPNRPKRTKSLREKPPSYIHANPRTWCPGGDPGSAGGMNFQGDTERLISDSTSGYIWFSESWPQEGQGVGRRTWNLKLFPPLDFSETHHHKP